MTTKELVRAALFTAMICVITILPRIFQPAVVIPFSLQPFIILLAGYLLPPRAAFLSILAYIMLVVVANFLAREVSGRLHICRSYN